MKKGKAPGLSGWTRELLEVVLFAPKMVCLEKQILTIFGDIANMHLHPFEKEIIKNGILIPFVYAAKKK